MSMIKVSSIEDEPNEMIESDDPLEDELSEHIETVKDIEPLQPKTKPKRIRKKPEPKQEPKQEPIITQPLPPPPPIPEKQRIQGKMIKCNICGKELLEKTFKYYHKMKCAPKETIKAATITTKPDIIDVGFNFQRRVQIKQDRFANLFTKAF